MDFAGAMQICMSELSLGIYAPYTIKSKMHVDVCKCCFSMLTIWNIPVAFDIVQGVKDDDARLGQGPLNRSFETTACVLFAHGIFLEEQTET